MAGDDGRVRPRLHDFLQLGLFLAVWLNGIRVSCSTWKALKVYEELQGLRNRALFHNVRIYLPDETYAKSG